jgi:hypothetical protein
VYRAPLGITGHTLDDARRQRMSPDFIYVGVRFELDRLISAGYLRIDVKPGRRKAILTRSPSSGAGTG